MLLTKWSMIRFAHFENLHIYNDTYYLHLYNKQETINTEIEDLIGYIEYISRINYKRLKKFS